jgi:hypothetical protein
LSAQSGEGVAAAPQIRTTYSIVKAVHASTIRLVFHSSDFMARTTCAIDERHRHAERASTSG